MHAWHRVAVHFNTRYPVPVPVNGSYPLELRDANSQRLGHPDTTARPLCNELIAALERRVLFRYEQVDGVGREFEVISAIE
jgi:hypothetical protein